MMNPIVWQPEDVHNTRMWQFKQRVEEKYQQTFVDYQQLHEWSIQQPEQFWATLAEFFHVAFKAPPAEILSQTDPMINAEWFTGATLNYAEHLLWRDDSHPALISLDETGKRQVLTYEKLRREVARCAAALKHAGITQGDRVAAVMPNVPQTIIAFLATASIGAIWSSCATDFGLQTILDRLGQIEPKILFISNGHQYQGKRHNDCLKAQALLEKMPSLAQVVLCPVIPPETTETVASPKMIAWEDFLSQGLRHQPDHSIFLSALPFNHPLYILFSSGTTGQPKCIVHSAGGVLLQHLKELGLHTNLGSQDNLFFFTTCGWMMWNWMVSGLALGATLTLYEGSPTYPDIKRFFQIIQEERVSVFGTSAKFISAVEKQGVQPRQLFDMPALRCILSTGSPLLPKNYDFVSQQIKPGVQLSSIAGGTDIVSCFALGNPMLPVYRGELQCLGLGMSVEIFDEDGEAIREARGELVCTKPFPAMPLGFWHDPDKKRYQKAYFERFPGIWAHGDFAEITAHHGLIIYGRSDTVLNPGGVRIGTAEIYRQVEKISEVIDSVVIGQDWEDDVRIVLFVQLKPPAHLDEALKKTICETIRQNASPRHVPSVIIQVPEIPKTISGKVVELAVRQVVHGLPVQNLQSLANPNALAYFKNHEILQTQD